jgi:hypothetical protein
MFQQTTKQQQLYSPWNLVGSASSLSSRQCACWCVLCCCQLSGRLLPCAAVEAGMAAACACKWLGLMLLLSAGQTRQAMPHSLTVQQGMQQRSSCAMYCACITWLSCDRSECNKWNFQRLVSFSFGWYRARMFVLWA